MERMLKRIIYFVCVCIKEDEENRFISCHPKIPLLLNREALEHIHLMERFIIPARVCDSTVSMKYRPAVSSRPNS